MISPELPEDEHNRIRELHQLNILDTIPEERFDRFTRLARRLFNVPIALVSLVDAERQWFKSQQGLAATETPRDISFCGHAILGREPMVVEDASIDERFHDNPLVTGDPSIRFYAGYPVQGPGGHPVGTVCLIDREPRSLTADDLEVLGEIGALVEAEIASAHLAMTDELTGISNRRGFDMLSTQALAMCERNAQQATVIMIDMDGFKEINDKFGHQTGDSALKEFAHIMLATFRDSDIVARLGGDEFCALLTRTDTTQAEVGVQRLLKAVEEANDRSEAPYTLRFSAGIASCSGGSAENIEKMLQAADQSMYESKRTSGSRIRH